MKKHYFRLTIEERMSKYVKQENFQLYETGLKNFKTIGDVRKYLEENYISKTRQPIYRDDEKGKQERIGTIYSSKHKNEGGTYYLQDWVTIEEVDEEANFVLI